MSSLPSLQTIGKTVLVFIHFQGLENRAYEAVPLESLHLCQLSVVIHRICMTLKTIAPTVSNTATSLYPTNTETQKIHIARYSTKKCVEFTTTEQLVLQLTSSHPV